MAGHQYFVRHRGPCSACGGEGDVPNHAWVEWYADEIELVAAIAAGEVEEDDVEAHQRHADRLEREHGPSCLVCTRCAGTGQVEDEVPLEQGLELDTDDVSVTEAGKAALRAEDLRRRDLFVAAALSGLLRTESTITMDVARRVATSAALVAAATLEQLAYHDRLLTGDREDTCAG